MPPASPATTDTARRWLRSFGLIAGLAGEMFIALAATAERPTDDRLSYVLLRLQNRWSLEIWSTLDEQLPVPPSPWQLAVYFALGWTQFSTTWTWPQTERWSALFAAEAPEHWLPRAHWHLCWLTYDPKLRAHLEALDTALRDGETDTALPGYAAAFRKILGRCPPGHRSEHGSGRQEPSAMR